MAYQPYKGLTIRFGADTSEFTTKLNALNSIIGRTQTQLRQMTNALKGDPTNLQALTAKFRLLQDQAETMASKLRNFKTVLAEMDAKGLGKLYEQFGGVDNYIRAANEQVLTFNKELNAMYARLTEIGERVGIAFNKKDIEGWYEKIKASDKVTAELRAEIDSTVKSVYNLKEGQRKASEEFERIKEEAGAYKQVKTDIAQAEAELNGFVAQARETRSAMSAMSAEGRKLDILETELHDVREEGRSVHEQLSAVNQALKATGYKNMEMLEKAVELTADEILNAKKQLETMNKQLDVLRSQTGMQRITESADKLQADLRDVNQRWEAQQRHIAEVKAEIRKAAQVIDSYKAKESELVTLTRQEEVERKQATQQLTFLETHLKSATDRARMLDEEMSLKEARVAQQKLQAELTQTSAKMQTLTARTKTFGAAALNSVRDFATGLGATIGPAVMMVGTYAITAGEQIDAAFRDMKKTVDGTEVQFQRLRDAAVEFSKTHPVSADTILEIEAMGGQLGIAVDELEQFATVVSNLDIATNMKAEDIAIDLGKLGNVMHLTTADFERFGDTLVNLGNNYPALESDIMNITTRFAGMATIVGVMPDEILAIATAATATGQKADAAGGSLQRTFGRIEGAVAGVSDAMRNLDEMTEEDIEAFEEAKDKLKDYADIAGMSVEQFASLWENTTQLEEGVSGTTSAFQAFIEGLKRIDDEGGSVDATLQKLGITGVRDRQLLEGLTNTTEVLDNALKSANKSWGDYDKGIASSGDAAREASQKAEGFSGKLQMIQNTAQAMGDSFTSKLLPVMDELLDLLRGAAEWVDNLSEAQAGAIAKAAAFTIALAPVLRIVSQTAITMGNLTSNLGAGAVKFAGFMKAATESGAGMKGLTKILDAADGETIKLGKALKDAASGFGDYIRATGTAVQGSGKLTGAMGKLLSSMTLAKAGAIGLAVAGIIVVANAIATYIKKQEEYHKSTDRFNQSLYATSGAFKDQAASVGYGSSTYRSMGAEIDALIEKQAKLYDELSQSTQETATSVQMLDHWNNVIKENNNATEDQLGSVARLEDAVKNMNEAYGTTWEVMKDEETGKYRIVDANGEEVKSIDNLIEAKKREVRQNAILNAELKIEEQRIEAKQKLAEAQRNLAVAQENYNEALEKYPEYANDYLKLVQEAEGSVKTAQEAVDALDKSERSLDAQLERVTNAVDENGQKILELADEYPILAASCDGISKDAFPRFIEALEKAGGSVEELNALSASEIDEMTKNWSEGGTSWTHAVEVAHDRISQEARKTDEEAVAAFEKMKTDTIKEVSEMTGLTEKEVEDMMNTVGVDSELAMRTWVENIRNGKIPVKDATHENTEAVRQQLENAKRDAATAGANLTIGFAEGILSKKAYSDAKAQAVASSAANSLKQTLNERSPSRLTRQFGQYFTEGFALGIADEADEAEKQAALLGSIAAGALQSSKAMSAATLSGRAMAAMGYRGSTTNNNDNSVENIHITLNVEARDMRDVQTIQDIVNIAKRAQAQYAS